MPEACAEPYEEEVEILSRSAENRRIEKIISEEGAERDVPSLPELTDILTDERIFEVFVEMEAEHASKTYRHIGISAEIKVYIE